MRVWARLCLALAACVFVLSAAGEVGAVAFPGAEGHGAGAVGGRGGAVLFVTSLADHGPGTLREALAQAGPRTVVFRVGGTITLHSPLVISNPYVTVAGQTAPGGGIQLRNDPDAPYGVAGDSFTSLVIDANDVVIRYLRIRPGPLTPNRSCRGPNAVRHPQRLKTCVDAADIQAIALEDGARRVMLDHLSLAWSSDEMLDYKGAREVSLQWSIVGEGMDYALYSGHYARPSSTYGHGVLIGNIARAKAGETNGRLAFHHNLFSLLSDRTPQVTVNCPSAARPLDCASDVVNNYVYGWGRSALAVANLIGHTYVNVVNNYFREGRDSQPGKATISVNDWGSSPTAALPNARLGLHLVGNLRRRSDQIHEGAATTCVRLDQRARRWDRCSQAMFQMNRYATPRITTTDALTAQGQVLANAGANRRLDQYGGWLPARDAADARMVTDAGRGTGRIIKSYADFPGWPRLTNDFAPTDGDRDGMPDVWESRQRCLAVGRSDHPLDVDRDGWTNLEEYLNGTPPCVR